MEIKAVQEKATPILRRAGVRRAGLFGSIIKGKTRPNDVDILVEMDKQTSLLGFIYLKNQLEEELGQRVDLVEYGALKPSLREGIIKEAVALFG